MLVTCNICGTNFDTEDECGCPQCGALSYMIEDSYIYDRITEYDE
jgi:predicted  nucleic acid-binding Zn-ribbon protein